MHTITRRIFFQRAGALGLLAAVERLAPAYAWAGIPDAQSQGARPTGRVIDLTIGEVPFRVNGRTGTAVAMNGTVPGPLIRLREGEEAVIRVTNRLEEITSIHWHGIILPPDMDGVPGVSFAGIGPGEVFTYRFPVRQSGTYWAHSHSGGQELLGLYFPLLVDPAEPEPFQYDRDYVVMFSDWSFESPETIISNVKEWPGYYNFQKRTMPELFSDIANDGLLPTIKERLAWTKTRMDPTDLADVTSATYTYLINGLPSSSNWTGLFRSGEKVRLRFIDGGAMTYFDVRIPGVKMTLVQVDGQNVKPVVMDEFRIGPGETYDVIVEPAAERAYTIFAESLDRSGFVRGTLAPRLGMSAPIPERRTRLVRTMADMGMEMSGMEKPGMNVSSKGAGADGMTGMAGAPAMPVMPSAPAPFELTFMPGFSMPDISMPMSAMVRTRRVRRSGIGALMPSRGAPIPERRTR